MRGTWIVAGSVLAPLAVALGAFGTHALRGEIPPDRLAVFATGVQYHQMHALALILLGLFEAQRNRTRLSEASGWLFTIGIVVFGGSLYLLAITGIRWLGAITPLGGAAFLAGWACFALAAYRSTKAV